ncbi:MAG: nucleoside triphosphate pyrophosphohydrolase [Bacteroidetes bacterium]|nr:nucleoside triphosphate pyrophosphohydrolase [Bacteroidota bacterium]
MEEKLKAFGRLLEIMDDLREKCPWDRKQTMDSLRYLTIEETYELSDAIIDKDLKGVKEELGDILLHMVFYSKIGEEQKAFDVADVLHAVCDKLVHRHPHIYGDVEVADEEEVKKNWEKLKLKEGKKSVLEGVPRSLPAMVKAYRVQQKVKQLGFQWKDASGALDKVEEEMMEMKEAYLEKDHDELEKEMGDVLFSIINFARYMEIDAEKALEMTNKKFIARFQWMEVAAANDNLQLHDMTLAEMDVLWNKAKEILPA